MLDTILFSGIPLPGETIRILIAFVGLVVATYFDLFNRKNIPENFLYAFLGISFLANLYFYNQELSLFAIITAILVSLFGYLFYRAGQLGGADVFILASLSLLLPVHPSFSKLPFNFPFIFSLLIFSGVLFALYTILYFGIKLTKIKSKPNIPFLALLIPYFLFLYFYSTLPFFSPAYLAIVSVVLFSTIFFLIYKNNINKLLSEKIPLRKAEEEDVLALEFMPKNLVKKYNLRRILTLKEIKRLKSLKLKEVYVFTNLPPFLPFLLVGFLFSLFFAGLLVLSM